MEHIFITPVSMQVTKEQYNNDLKEPLKELGYKQYSINWRFDYLVTNYGVHGLGELSTLQEDAKGLYDRPFIDHYNPELFLALAAMTEGDDWIVGEWATCIVDYGDGFRQKNLYQCKGMSGNTFSAVLDSNNCPINGWHKDKFRKASKQELISHLSKQDKDMSKDNRFPIEMTGKQAQRIIDIACSTWKPRLAARWGKEIVLNTCITIYEDEYNTMREACCNDEQHTLFDEIFGEDVVFPYKAGDWVYCTGECYNDTNNEEYKRQNKNGEVFEIAKIVDARCSGGGKSIVSNDGICIYAEAYPEAVRLATPEEIEKAKHPKDGTPCLVKANGSQVWRLAYADGNGKFYYDSLKSGGSNKRDQYRVLDMDNLPVNE